MNVIYSIVELRKYGELVLHMILEASVRSKCLALISIFMVTPFMLTEA